MLKSSSPLSPWLDIFPNLMAKVLYERKMLCRSSRSSSPFRQILFMHVFVEGLDLLVDKRNSFFSRTLLDDCDGQAYLADT